VCFSKVKSTISTIPILPKVALRTKAQGLLGTSEHAPARAYVTAASTRRSFIKPSLIRVFTDPSG